MFVRCMLRVAFYKMCLYVAYGLLPKSQCCVCVLHIVCCLGLVQDTVFVRCILPVTGYWFCALHTRIASCLLQNKVFVGCILPVAKWTTICDSN